MPLSDVGGVGGLPPDVAGAGAGAGATPGAKAAWADAIGKAPEPPQAEVDKFAQRKEVLTKNAVTKDAAAEEYMQNSMVSTIVSNAYQFAQQLPGNVSGDSLVGQAIEKAKKGASDPADPGADALQPDE